MKFPYILTTKSNNVVTIRPPKSGDAPALLAFINTLSLEQTFITMQGEQQTLKDEQKYLRSMIQKIKNHEAAQLLAIHNGAVVANTSIQLGARVTHHVGTFAISVSEGYRDESIGSTIMSLLLQHAKDSLPDLKIIELRLFANNPKAKHVYEKLGFKECGRIPKGILYKGNYVDELLMYKEV